MEIVQPAARSQGAAAIWGQMASERRSLQLHLNVQAIHPGIGSGLDQVAMRMLAVGTKGVWQEGGTKMTYADHVVTVLHPDNVEDTGLASKREEAIQRFVQQIQADRHPMAGKVAEQFKTLQASFTEAVFPGLTKLVETLKEARTPFSLIFRTSEESDGRVEHFCSRQFRGQPLRKGNFDAEGVFHYVNAEGESVEARDPAQFRELTKDGIWLIQDGRTDRTRAFPISSDTQDKTVSLFVDTKSTDGSQVIVYDCAKAEQVDGTKFIVPVSVLKAALEPDYLSQKVANAAVAVLFGPVAAPRRDRRQPSEGSSSGFAVIAAIFAAAVLAYLYHRFYRPRIAI